MTMTPKCIYIVGPSSSGKSTLCDALAKDIGLPAVAYIKEVARTVMRTQGFTRANVDTFEMQYAIMTAQLRAENTAISNKPAHQGASSILFLSDRSAVDPIVYAASSSVAQVRDMAPKLRRDPEFEAALPRYRASLFVLLAPVTEWIKDDGVRSLENPWRYIDCLRNVLYELDIPFREIGEGVKDIGHRTRLVKQWATL